MTAVITSFITVSILQFICTKIRLVKGNKKGLTRKPASPF